MRWYYVHESLGREEDELLLLLHARHLDQDIHAQLAIHHVLGVRDEDNIARVLKRMWNEYESSMRAFPDAHIMLLSHHTCDAR
jgi:hypothetical protein